MLSCLGEILSLGRVTPSPKTTHRPRLDEVSTKTSQLIPISHLGETFSPERDPSSLKPPNPLAWAENRAQHTWSRHHLA